MATFTRLNSGKWRVQVRRGGVYRAASFERKRDAEDWASEVERQAGLVAVRGYAPAPTSATVADLIDRYEESTPAGGKTKTATLNMLRADRIGKIRLAALNAIALRDFVDRRVKQGAGGVTIAADLSFLSAVLKWGKHARRLDLPADLALDARRDLQYRGLKTRSTERDREPSDAELSRLYAHWDSNEKQRIDMTTLCRFALATAMRLGEICRIAIEDIDVIARTAIIRDRKDPRNKSGNDQTVPLLPDAWAIVEPIIRERSSGYLFPVNPASVSTAFTRACDALGIDDLHFHDLRHRATADLFRHGLDIPTVALMTGHKTWSMLRRYTAIRPADVHARFNAARDDNKPAGKRAARSML